MSDDTDRTLASAPSEEDLEQLFSALGARDEVPRDVLDEMEVATHHAWRQQLFTAKRKKRRRMAQIGLLAAAAMLLLFLGSRGVARLLETPSGAPVVVASIEQVVGRVRLETTGEPVAPMDVLEQGAVLEAADASGTVLRLNNQAEIRLAPSSRLRIGSAGELELESGRVYVDTRADSANEVRVTTAWGVATDIGTRFMVEAGRSRTAVQVREGRVELAAFDTGQRPGATATATATATVGERLVINETGEFSRSQAPPDDPSWSWIQALAQPFELESSTLDQYLTWLKSETGYQIRFENEASEAALLGVQLHGSIAGLEPTETIDDALLSAGLEATLSDGVLTIIDAP